jgi:hypothetical protein
MQVLVTVHVLPRRESFYRCGSTLSEGYTYNAEPFLARSVKNKRLYVKKIYCGMLKLVRYMPGKTTRQQNVMLGNILMHNTVYVARYVFLLTPHYIISYWKDIIYIRGSYYSEKILTYIVISSCRRRNVPVIVAY